MDQFQKRATLNFPALVATTQSVATVSFTHEFLFVCRKVSASTCSWWWALSRSRSEKDLWTVWQRRLCTHSVRTGCCGRLRTSAPWYTHTHTHTHTHTRALVCVVTSESHSENPCLRSDLLCLCSSCWYFVASMDIVPLLELPRALVCVWNVSSGISPLLLKSVFCAWILFVQHVSVEIERELYLFKSPLQEGMNQVKLTQSQQGLDTFIHHHYNWHYWLGTEFQ